MAVLKRALNLDALDQSTPVEVLCHVGKVTYDQVNELCERRLLQLMNDGYRVTAMTLLYFPEAYPVLDQLDRLVRHAHRLYEPGARPVRLDALDDPELLPAAFNADRARYVADDLKIDLRPDPTHSQINPTSSNAQIATLEEAFHHAFGVSFAPSNLDDDAPSAGAFAIRLTAVHAVRFRSLHDNTLKLRPDGLTVLVGPNASGKSTLLDSIAFLANAGRSGIGRAIEAEGGVERLRTRGDKGTIELEAEFTADMGDKKPRRGRYRFAFDGLGRPALGASHVVEEELLALDRQQGEQTLLHGMRGVVTLLQTNGKTTEAFRNPHELTLPRARGNGLLAELRRDLGSVVLIDRDPLITAVADRTARTWMSRANVARRRYVASSEEILRDVVNDAERVEQLSHALCELVPNVTHVRQVGAVDKDCRLEIQERDIDGASTWEEISAGTRQMLLLCSLYVHPHPPRIILLEEPDAALHAGALPVLRDLLRSIATRSVVVATTHSPAFVNLLDPEREAIAVSRDGTGTHVRSLKAAMAEKQWLQAFGSTGEAFLRMSMERDT